MTLFRQGIRLPPMLLVLPRIFGLVGIQPVQPVSDIFSAVIALLVTKGILDEMWQKAAEQERQ